MKTKIAADVRERIIADILAAARKPIDEIVPVYELEYTDGSWRVGDHPSFNARTTGQRRVVGYALMDRQGRRYGQRCLTAEEVRARHDAYEDRKAEDFRAHLEESDDARLREQAAYWLKEEV